MSPQKNAIHTDRAPAAIGTYSQAIAVGQTVYLSGQIALDPQTQEMVTDSFEAEVHQVFRNLRAVCEAAGGRLLEVVKLTIYLTDLSHFSTVNKIMLDYFEQPYPARAAVGVKELPKGARVEADGIMVIG
ncbi:RidA family protein [Sinimarinibacterium sp. NLF-5-8]|uniref:RidA family protein n=1 Tax=Sinimarinibacterium sp. NLF-5-8 TaxID=2698684 RepID=UPI00137BBE0C|nr:RidA family protein [Sinimarinibacterium sp. NLF-5-8]QHS11026.1 RidA family protein [Sinimarinibacterium sp. NLF-5-8]